MVNILEHRRHDIYVLFHCNRHEQLGYGPLNRALIIEKLRYILALYRRKLRARGAADVDALLHTANRHLTRKLLSAHVAKGAAQRRPKSGIRGVYKELGPSCADEIFLDMHGAHLFKKSFLFKRKAAVNYYEIIRLFIDFHSLAV